MKTITPSFLNTGLPLGLFALWAMLFSVSAHGQQQPKIVDVNNSSRVIWGFNGRVVPNAFNPVSILVDNPTPQPFNGTVRLEKVSGLQQSDFVEVQELYLAPATQRWLQFTVYFEDDSSFRLSWEDGNKNNPYALKGDEVIYQEHSYDQRLNFTHNAGVYLFQEGNLLTHNVNFPRYPANMFPTSIAATEHLKLVVMDHVAQFNSPGRIQTFLDWLHGGGVVYICQSNDGVWPKFEGELNILNGVLPEYSVGAGRVYHVPMSLKDAVQKSKRENALWGSYAGQHKINSTESSSYKVSKNDSYDQTWLRNLHTVIAPEHDWAIFSLIAVVYILVIGPGFYLVARKKMDYKIGYVLLVGLIVITTYIFKEVGARGYGESTTAVVVGHATALSNDRFNLTQYVDLFTTDSGQYTIQYPAADVTYTSVVPEYGRNGLTFQSSEKPLRLDMPLYSHRPFMVNARVKGPSLDFKIENIEWNNRDVKRAKFTLNPAWNEYIEEAWLGFDKEYAPLNVSKSTDQTTINFNRTNRVSWKSMSGKYNNNYYYRRYRYRSGRQGLSSTAYYDKLIEDELPLMLWKLHHPAQATEQYQNAKQVLNLQEGQAELILLVSPPESMKLKSEHFKQQYNKILIRIPVDFSAAKGDSPS